MNFTVKPELKILYPGAHFGSLTTNNLQNMKKNSDLETTKRSLEQKIRETYPDPANDPTISDYNLYYAKWSKIYPIAFQIKSIKTGRNFPNVSTYVDAMFLSELENRILTSGHDRDAIQGTLTYDLAEDGEEYVKLNGKKQTLVKNDVVLRDNEGILGSILFGPAARTSITNETANPLYFAWCPIGINMENIQHHLGTILEYLKIVYGEIQSEQLIYKLHGVCLRARIYTKLMIFDHYNVTNGTKK